MVREYKSFQSKASVVFMNAFKHYLQTQKIRHSPLIKLKRMMDIEPIQARIIIMYNIVCQSHEVTESATRRSFEVPHIYIRYVSISR